MSIPVIDHELCRAILSHLPEAVVLVDQRGEMLFGNAAAAALLPGGPAGLLAPSKTAGYRLLPTHRGPEGAIDWPLARILDGHHLQDEELLVEMAGAPGARWLSLSSCALAAANPSENQTILLTLRDISAAKQRQQVHQPQDLIDAVTGLPNRLLLEDRLQHALDLAHSRVQGLAALLYIAIWEGQPWEGQPWEGQPWEGQPWEGQPAAAAQIEAETWVALTHRLEEHLRPEITLARLEDGAFVVLAETLNTGSAAIDLAETLHTALTQPGLPQSIEAHVGIALGPASYTAAAPWLRDAALSANRAQANPAQPWQVFDNPLWTQQDLTLQTEIDLRRGLERGELRLHYQPIVTISNQEICGFEALVRWQHPTRGLLMPGDFIQIAETSGLIVPLGQWVMAEACRQMQAWTEAYPAMASYTISVNLSSRQFSQPHLVEDIQRLLAETGLAANRLKIEITEGVLIDHSDSIITILERLKAMGIKLLVDDFGTGYSSLSYLHQFPFDCLKIDRSFIENADQDFEKLEILQSVVRLAWNLGLDVVAEGVETPRHHAQLKALRCQLGQGYLFSKPLAPEAVEAMMAKMLTSADDSTVTLPLAE